MDLEIDTFAYQSFNQIWKHPYQRLIRCYFQGGYQTSNKPTKTQTGLIQLYYNRNRIDYGITDPFDLPLLKKYLTTDEPIVKYVNLLCMMKETTWKDYKSVAKGMRQVKRIGTGFSNKKLFRVLRSLKHIDFNKNYHVLDPYAGWGHRMYFAILNNWTYEGFDTNSKLCESLRNMIDWFNKEEKCKIINDRLITYHKRHNVRNPNLIYTCPPYLKPMKSKRHRKERKDKMIEGYENMPKVKSFVVDLAETLELAKKLAEDLFIAYEKLEMNS